VRYAVSHLTERQSIMAERVLLDVAVKQAVGAATLRDIQAEIRKQTAAGYLLQEAPKYRPADAKGAGGERTRTEWIDAFAQEGSQSRSAAALRVNDAIRRGSLTPVEVRYTTQTAREREKLILQIERDGRGVVPAIVPPEALSERLSAARLNAGQRTAAELILTTRNRVVAVQGFAGTGKSHMLNSAKAEIEAEGFTMRALAPYGSQVKALRELGVTSNTLASFLKARDKAIDARSVLVIDEAGVVPTRLMTQALQIAEKAGARVVLVGDTAQTKAIEAGRPFDQLQVAGMATARMTEIQRQKDPILKEAVELAAKGAVGASLDRISSINEIVDDRSRRAAIASDYLKLSPTERDGTLIVSGTNEARRDINQRVREGLGMAGQGIEFDTLVRRDTTQAERQFSKNYHVGDVIQPEKDFRRTGLQRGALYTVEDTGPGNRLTVRAEAGDRITFSPMTHRQISVYKPERAEFSRGDVVRITRNDAQLDLANGDRFKVARVTPGRVVLSDGSRDVTLDTAKPLHVDHAYATTVHSAQGLTSDRVLIDAHSKSITTAKDIYYVAISRARHEARIYTNSVKELPAAISRESVKHAALDLARAPLQRERKPIEAGR
jgi:ATP-dependent exoDNAse (exonuclease V) alpha subunit